MALVADTAAVPLHAAVRVPAKEVLGYEEVCSRTPRASNASARKEFRRRPSLVAQRKAVMNSMRSSDEPHHWRSSVTALTDWRLPSSDCRR